MRARAPARRRASRGRWVAALAVASSALALGVSGAIAQPLPLPGLGASPTPEPSKRSAPPPGTPLDPNKVYTKPSPLPLPEGEVTVASGPVAVVKFQGIVNPGMGSYTVSAIQRAEAEGAQAVLVELDTPGGLVSTTQTMVQAILGAKVPVIVWVTPSGSHAASAGTMITMAGHVAAMSPATRIGAAHPVTGDGKDPEEEGGSHMGRKVENDLAAFAQSIAETRGRNAEWAIDAVRHSVSITEARALEIGVIDLVAADRRELFEALDGRVVVVGKAKIQLATKGATTVTYEPSLRERVVNLLANPGIAMVLGILGLIGIMVEIYHPGMIAPGVMGVLCVICSLIAMEQLPIDVGGAILVVAGIGLVVAELYTPTFGVLGVLGGLGLTIGLVLLVDPAHPDYALDPSFRLSLMDVLPMVFVLGVVVAYISWAVMGVRKKKPVTGREELIGARGHVLKPVSAAGGMVFVHGEYWSARSSEALPEQAKIEVVSVDGLVLVVRPERPA